MLNRYLWAIYDRKRRDLIPLGDCKDAKPPHLFTLKKDAQKWCSNFPIRGIVVPVRVRLNVPGA